MKKRESDQTHPLQDVDTNNYSKLLYSDTAATPNLFSPTPKYIEEPDTIVPWYFRSMHKR